MKNKLQEIKDEIASILDEIKYAEEPGSILYSGDETIKKGKYYFLGANPGGHSDEALDNDTISNQLYRINSSPTFNEYFDAIWQPGNKTYPKGMAPLQKRIKYLFNYLEINLRDTLSTNLNFVRSSRMINFPYNWNQAAENCWEIHKILLSIVRPEIILVFGDDAYDFMHNKIKSVEYDDFTIHSYGGRQTYTFCCLKGSLLLDNIELSNLQLIKVPHLSYLKIDSKGMDYGDAHDTREVLKWVKGKVA